MLIIKIYSSLCACCGMCELVGRSVFQWVVDPMFNHCSLDSIEAWGIDESISGNLFK